MGTREPSSKSSIILTFQRLHLVGVAFRPSQDSIGFVHRVGPLRAFLDHIPKLGHVQGSRYAHTRLTSRKQGGDCAARLRPALLRIREYTRRDDGDVEALVVLGVLAALCIPVVKGDFIGSTCEDGGDSEGVMQWRAFCDAKYIAVKGVFVLAIQEEKKKGAGIW